MPEKAMEGGPREILMIAFPLIASHASHTVLTFTDRMFLSWHSPHSIAASGPAAILSFTIICFFKGVSSYVSTLIAQNYGAKKTSRISKSLWQGLYFSAMSAVALVALIPVGNFIIRHSGHGEDVIELEIRYFSILMFGGGLVVLEGALASFFSGLGRTKVIMYIWVAGALINIGLDYILIFGKLGLPELGITGAGIATVSTQFIIAVIYFALIFQKSHRIRFRIHKLRQFNKELFFKLIKYGVPEGTRYFLDIAGFSAFLFFVGTHGDVELAASTMTIFVDMMAFMPMLGIGIATSILVGQYIGKGKKDVAVIVTKNSVKISAIYGAIIGSLFWFYPELFINIFKGDDAESFAMVSAAAIPIFKILPFFLMADALNIILGAGLSGAGDTRFKVYAALIVSICFFVPGEFLILRHWNMPVTYGWWLASVNLLILGSVYMIRFKQGKWKRIDMIYK